MQNGLFYGGTLLKVNSIELFLVSTHRFYYMFRYTC